MRPEILLRIASIIMVLHTVGHTFGTLGWKKTPDPTKQEVIRQMTENRFPFMGASKSMGDAMDGYGFSAIGSLLLMAILLWLASNSTGLETNLVRNILIVIAVNLLVLGVCELIYFFPLAAGFTLLAFLLTLVAIFQINKTSIS